MDVSIGVRTKNEGQSIGETLQRIRGQEFTGTFETIIVDSGSTDSTLDVVETHDVTLVKIPPEEFSYGYSLNVGASVGSGTYVVNLSAHAFPKDKTWLTSLLEGFDSPNVAGVYGRQVSIGHVNPFEACLNDRFFGSRKLVFNRKSGETLNRIQFSNSNCAVRRDVWQRYKFDEEVPYAEDILWQTEVIRAGFSIVYSPEAAVYHTHRVDMPNVYKVSRDCAYSLAVIAGKRQSICLALYDAGIFLALAQKALLQNVSYMCRRGHHGYLKMVPGYVICSSFGWLVGRIKYRLKR